MSNHNSLQNINPEFQQPELTLKEIVFLLRRGWKIIAITTFIAVLFSLYYAFTVNPVFTASTTILIESDDGMSSLFDFPGSMEMSDIMNVIEIISSRKVAKETIKELWFSQHRNNLQILETRRFHAKGEQFQNLIREISSFGTYDPTLSEPKIYTEIDYSDTLIQRLVHQIVKNEVIKISNKRETDILVISCTSSFPEEAALLANTITNVFQNMDKKWNAEESLNLRDFLADQLTIKEKELVKAENKLQEYKESEQIFSLDGNAEKILEQLVIAESKYMESIAEVNISNEQKTYYNSILSKEEKSLLSRLRSSINARLLALRTEIGLKEADAVRNSSLYGEQHEMVQSLFKEIDGLKLKLDEETNKLISQGLAVADPIEYRQELIKNLLTADAKLSEMDVRSKEYKKLVNKYEKEINRLPKKQLEFARLERDRIVLAEIFGFMRQKLEEARISVASETGTIRIIDTAFAPTKKTSPKNKMNLLLGLILGGGLGVGIIFLMEYLDNTIRSVDYLEKLNLTVLGVIPQVGSQYKKKTAIGSKQSGKDETDIGNGIKSMFTRPTGDKLKRHMVTREDPKSPISESYRMIRTNILYSKTDDPIKSILVSSPGPGEGKTTTVTNLGITFANLGMKTILIDGDLRRPVVHRIFDLQRDPGLSHYLSGHTKDINSLIHDTDIENLHVLPAGITPPNPSELLGSKKMTDLIIDLKKDWDMVLIDSPPITAVTDATMVSHEVDSLVLVIKAGGTIKESLIRAMQSLNGLDIHLSGAVLNSVSKRSSYDSYYYYYQYYYHYYGGDKT